MNRNKNKEQKESQITRINIYLLYEKNIFYSKA